MDAGLVSDPEHVVRRSLGNAGRTHPSTFTIRGSFRSDPPTANPSNGSEPTHAALRRSQRLVRRQNHAVHRLVADVPKVLEGSSPPTGGSGTLRRGVARDGTAGARRADDDVRAEFFWRRRRLGRRDRAVAATLEQDADSFTSSRPAASLCFACATSLADRPARRAREKTWKPPLSVMTGAAADEDGPPGRARRRAGLSAGVRVREHHVHARVHERLCGTASAPFVPTATNAGVDDAVGGVDATDPRGGLGGLVHELELKKSRGYHAGNGRRRRRQRVDEPRRAGARTGSRRRFPPRHAVADADAYAKDASAAPAERTTVAFEASAAASAAGAPKRPTTPPERCPPRHPPRSPRKAAARAPRPPRASTRARAEGSARRRTRDVWGTQSDRDALKFSNRILTLPSGTVAAAARRLSPLSRVFHARPRLRGLQRLALLQQLHGDAVRDSDEGHLAVRGRLMTTPFLPGGPRTVCRCRRWRRRGAPSTGSGARTSLAPACVSPILGARGADEHERELTLLGLLAPGLSGRAPRRMAIVLSRSSTCASDDDDDARTEREGRVSDESGGDARAREGGARAFESARSARRRTRSMVWRKVRSPSFGSELYVSLGRYELIDDDAMAGRAMEARERAGRGRSATREGARTEVARTSADDIGACVRARAEEVTKGARHPHRD